jgi:hypothetical protein
VPTKKRITHGISFPDPRVFKAAKQKAAAMQISFSTYVNHLIRRDLGYEGVLDWKGPEEQPPSSHRMKKGRFREPYPLDEDKRSAK